MLNLRLNAPRKKIMSYLDRYLDLVLKNASIRKSRRFLDVSELRHLDDHDIPRLIEVIKILSNFCNMVSEEEPLDSVNDSSLLITAACETLIRVEDLSMLGLKSHRIIPITQEYDDGN